MALKQADRLESNNPAAYGVVRAVEISGHRTVQKVEDLYTIADCILSDSKTNENSDAIGQTWYVIETGCDYRLVDWDSRNSGSGWAKTTYSGGSGGTINDEADKDSTTETWSAKKISEEIQSAIESVGPGGKPIVEGSGTTIETTETGLKINLSVDDSSIKISEDGKLNVENVDGGIY